MSWHRYRGRGKCPLCEHLSPCMQADDGALWCYRVQSDRAMQLGDFHGWLHRAPSAAATVARLPRRSRPAPPDAMTLAPLDRRDVVHRSLARVLGLSNRHLQHLVHERGLPAHAIEGFATIRRGGEPGGVVAAHVQRETRAPLAGVPGFYRHGLGWRLVDLAPGFLIPVRDLVGRIQAFELRADDPPDPDHRYRPLSSNPATNSEWKGGCSPGKPVGVWRPELLSTSRDWWLVEGVLKGAIAAHKLEAPVFSISGVSSWRPALELVAAAAIGRPQRPRLVIAFDGDWRVNLHVWRARADLAEAATRLGYPVLSAEWERGQAKGIDDALLAGLGVGLEPYWREVPRATNPAVRRSLERAGAAR